MKLITRDTDYAVRALCYIAQGKERRVAVSALVAKLKIPRPFLRKILQTLNKKGLLRSYKGKEGGFELARPPEKIFIVDLMEAFQGPFQLNECLFKRRICGDVRSCLLKQKVSGIEREVISKLKAITIGSLIEGRSGRWKSI